jgi:hypothetical protein
MGQERTMATSVAAHKITRRPGAWFEGQLRRIGDQLFAAQDARARQRGWQITRQQSGLGRVYRDPRFDLLTIRPAAEALTGTGSRAAITRAPAARRAIIRPAHRRSDGDDHGA